MQSGPRCGKLLISHRLATDIWLKSDMLKLKYAKQRRLVATKENLMARVDQSDNNELLGGAVSKLRD